jgi:hypothetical protein
MVLIVRAILLERSVPRGNVNELGLDHNQICQVMLTLHDGKFDNLEGDMNSHFQEYLTDRTLECGRIRSRILISPSPLSGFHGYYNYILLTRGNS